MADDVRIPLPARLAPKAADQSDWQLAIPNPRQAAQPSSDDDQSAWDKVKTGAVAAGAGAATAGAALLLKGALRKAFPGFPGKTIGNMLSKATGAPRDAVTMGHVSALKRLDAAIRAADEKSSLKNEFSGYMRMTSQSDSPLTFADFLAQRPGMDDAVKAAKDMAGNSGNKPYIQNLLGDRLGAAQKDRILQAISDGMGVDRKGVTASIQDLMAQRSQQAQPLYDEAFRDKRPIRDTQLLDLFGTDTPNMAMMNALKARMKTLALQGRELPSLSAADPARRDAWKRLLMSDVPEHMFTAEPWAMQRPYYAPSIEDLHGMRQNLWDMHDAAMKPAKSVRDSATETEDSRAYLDSWKKVTNYLDDYTSGSYKAARSQYKGDSDLLNAHRIGTNLLKMKPDEARAAVAGMSPPERDALASGFYGGLEDTNTQRFIREFVARPERYPERQELLSTVFTDPTKLRTFLDRMTGEQAMQASGSTFGNLPLVHEAGPQLPYLRLSDAATMNATPHISALEKLGDMFGWPSAEASARGSRTLFNEPYKAYEPRGGGYNWMHPDWDKLTATPLSAGEQGRRFGKATAVGAGSGLAAYGASQIPSDQDFTPGAPGLEQLQYLQ